MIELLVVILATMLVFRLTTAPAGQVVATPTSARLTAQLAQLTEHANRLYAEKKWLSAEKAYLRVLKLDHKNAGAYSHLGIIYSTQKNYSDAVECFEIAARLKPSAVTYQNLGLAYYENRNYIKAMTAYARSVNFEPTASRYIGLSKARRKLEDSSGTILALEKAAELEPSRRILGLLEEAYRAVNRLEDARTTRQRIRALPADPAPVKHSPAA